MLEAGGDPKAGEVCRSNPVWHNLDPSGCRPALERAGQVTAQLTALLAQVREARDKGLQKPPGSDERYYALRQQQELFLREAHQCFDPMFAVWVNDGAPYNDPTWKCGHPIKPPTPSTSSVVPPSGSRNARNTCGTAKGPFRDEWDAWKHRAADAIAQHYQSPFKQRRTAYFEFTVDQQGRASGLTVARTNLSPEEQRRAGDAFQSALSAVNPSLLMPPASPRPEVVSLEVIQDASGCLGPGAHNQQFSVRAATDQDDCVTGTQMRLLAAASEMDRLATQVQNHSLAATDQYFRELVEGVEANLIFLAQPPGEPVNQIGAQAGRAFDAIVAYVNNRDPQKHQRLLDAATQMVAEYQRNKARFWGRMTANFLFEPIYGGAGAVSGACGDAIACSARVCRQGTCKVIAACTTRTTRATAEGARVEEAAERLREMQQAASAPGDDLLPNTCDKVDCFWRAMRNATGDAAFDGKLNGPAVESWNEVYATLKKYFGNKVKGVEFPALHQEGLPVPKKVDEILDELKGMGDGAEVIVFVGWKEGGAHAFNGANIKGLTILVDDQKQFWGKAASQQTVQEILKNHAAWASIYRTR
jgi:hypothetical protein